MISREDLDKKISEGKDNYLQLKPYLKKIDDRLDAYIYSNLYDVESHGTYEKLAIVRFLSFFYKYSFNVKAVKQYIRFADNLPIKSEQGMKMFPLQGFQIFVAASIFGWTKPNNKRLTRDLLLYVPRKASKSSMMAQLSIYYLLFGDPDGQIYCGSNSFNQSQVLFKIIEASIKSLDPKMKSFRRNRQQIYSVLPDNESFISCLSSSAERLDGLNASLVLMDEYSQADSAELRNVLTSSMGARSNPLTCTITTASTKLESPFTVMLSNYKKILEGEIENDAITALIFEVEEGDEISDERVWRRVQPMFGISIQEDFYEEEYKKALMSVEDMVSFKTKLLNMFCPPANLNWIKPEMLARNLVDFKLNKLTGKPICMVGVDLSVSDDMSAVTYGCYDSVTKTFAFYTDFYIPYQTMINHTNRDMYQRWYELGYLKIAGDETIDYQRIGDDIIENSQYVNILSIGYDSYKSVEFVNYLKARGVKVLHPYKQVYSEFTPPCVSFEIGLSEGKMKIDSNPIIEWMFRNVALDTDNMGNVKPAKGHGPSGKIDGVITILESVGQFLKWKR